MATRYTLCPPGYVNGINLVSFQADTLAHAQTTAQQFATMLQQACVLVPDGTTGPFTPTYTPAAPGSAIGNQATGISWGP